MTLTILTLILISSPTPDCHASPELVRLAEAEAQAHDLNPDIVKAVIRVESNWNPAAKSNKGAVGLMQLMPATLAREFSASVQEGFDSENNIHFGVSYLEKLNRRFGPDTRRVLAAYFSGRPNFDRPDVMDYIRRIHHEYTRQICR